MLQIAQLFPWFVEEEDKQAVMEKITRGELSEVLHSFQKDESLGLDGWPTEFHLNFYDFLGCDLLWIV